MGATGPKERATFSLDSETKKNLEKAVPKSERSQYVEKAIDRALREDARKQLSQFLDDLPVASGDESTTDYLRRKRQEWDGRPADVLEGKDA